MNGFVSLVGAGPGDPALITLAAARAIREADVVLYDALVHSAVLRHARTEAVVRFVGKRGGHEGTTQAQIHTLLRDYAMAGFRVCRLKGGDPLLFGRGSEEAEFLVDAGIAFEIVPGVSSFLGATAYAGISLTHRDLASSVALLTSSEHAEKTESAHDWAKLATATQTLVMFMGARKLRAEMDRLVRFGRSEATPAAAIEWGTFARQRVLTGTIGSLANVCDDANLSTPSLIVVGDVVSLRAHLRWWDLSVFARKCIALLRPEPQGEKLANDLRRAGAEVLQLPAVKIVDVEDVGPLLHAFARLGEYDLVLFSSANGVHRFASALNGSGRDWRSISQAKVIAIGAATRDALATRGLIADDTAQVNAADGLRDAVMKWASVLRPEKNLRDVRILFPRALSGREAVVTELRRQEMTVDVVPVYQTIETPEVLTPLVEALSAGMLDAVVLTSPSILRSLCAALGRDYVQKLAPVTVLAIGQTTRVACETEGIRVDVVPDDPSDSAILLALEQHYRKSHTPTPGS